MALPTLLIKPKPVILSVPRSQGRQRNIQKMKTIWKSIPKTFDIPPTIPTSSIETSKKTGDISPLVFWKKMRLFVQFFFVKAFEKKNKFYETPKIFKTPKATLRTLWSSRVAPTCFSTLIIFQKEKIQFSSEIFVVFLKLSMTRRLRTSCCRVNGSLGNAHVQW